MESDVATERVQAEQKVKAKAKVVVIRLVHGVDG